MKTKNTVGHPFETISSKNMNIKTLKIKTKKVKNWKCER